MTNYRLSQKGLDKLKKELEQLRTVSRPKALERLNAARAMGDLSENSEYTASRQNLELLDARLTEIQVILNDVEIINEVQDSSVVQLGDVVKVKVEDGHEEFSIVGELEADITKKQISDSSPIGKALLGSKVGSQVEVQIPAGTVVYKVVEIKKQA